MHGKSDKFFCPFVPFYSEKHCLKIISAQLQNENINLELSLPILSSQH
jgi:hypothetical protein